jgi:glycopeptide antibiotics resistance protein
MFNINITHNNLYLSHNAFTSFVKYNLCDGLWLASGILLLRFIWFGNPRTGNYYVAVFICVALLLELLQTTQFFPGTFDILDIFTMVLFALLEQCIYFYTKRRSLKWVKIG